MQIKSIAQNHHASGSSLLACAIVAAMLSGPVSAQVATPEASELVQFDIPAQPVSEALNAFSRQSGWRILFPFDAVAGRRARAVQGKMDNEAALHRLLADAGLMVASRENGVLTLCVGKDGKCTDRPRWNDLDTDKPVPEAPSRSGTGQPVAEMDRIVVTGTSLRGFAPRSSPLHIYTREEILGSGMASTEQFIRTLPQNFGGGSTEFTPAGVPGDQSTTFNNTFATGANLRGLGSGATLTLLNGRRLAPTSEIGDFVDLSMIPISALERVDVLTDGASSIYGGDAVAGVINFVLRQDFTGAETTARYGSVTRGDMSEYRVSQTFGKAWSSGNVLATYEHYRRGNLVLSDRREIPVPALSNGQPTIDTDSFDLLPKQKRHSAIVTWNQQIAPSLKVSATGLYSDRSANSTSVYLASTSSILNADTNAKTATVSVGADYAFSSRWQASLDATYSRIHSSEVLHDVAPIARFTNERVTKSDLWSVDALLEGSLFTLPGGVARAAVGGHFRRESLETGYLYGSEGNDREGARDVGAVYGEMMLPVVGSSNSRAGVQRLEINASARLDDYSDFGTTVNPKVGVLWSPTNGLNVRGTYSESFAPPPLGRTGDLRRTAAVLPFSYILQILGGIASPEPSLAGMDYMQTAGTAANLDPETSRTYTLGIDYAWHRGDHTWSASTTLYDIAFEGRLGATPIPQNLPSVYAPFLAFDDPGAFPNGAVIFFPAAGDVNAVVRSLVTPVIYQAGASGLDNIGIINNTGIVRNLASTRTRGLDFNLSHDFDAGFGRFNTGIHASYILDFTQRASAATPAVDVLSTWLNPVDLRLRGQIGLSRGGFSGNLFANHTDSYRTDGTQGAAPISSWTTFDLTMSYVFTRKASSWLDGASINLSVINLFDRAPPAVPPIGISRLAGYDPTNASPVMRFVAMEVRKTF